MKKIVKIIFFVLLALGLLNYAIYFEEINYGIRQGKGQLKIIFSTVPIEEKLADPSFSDSLKAQIALIQEIKQFTVEELGLAPSTSYTDYYEQNDKPLLWVLTACPPYSLENKKWKFPIVGEFAYKGHFVKERTVNEAIDLKAAGFDVRMGEVSAWSTLGYLSDPILSSMLKKEPGQLAALIIHELTHGTLFVKNDLTFNENLADFIGDQGATLFLKKKFSEQSKEYTDYASSKLRNEWYANHISKGTVKLDSLFQTFTVEMSSIKKDSLKYDLIDEIMLGAEIHLGKKRFKYGGRGSVNNAFFTAYRTYHGKQSEFEMELKSKFNNNFKAYLVHLKEKYNSIGR